jgi:ribosomal protein S6
MHNSRVQNTLQNNRGLQSRKAHSEIRKLARMINQNNLHLCVVKIYIVVRVFCKH